MEVSKCEKSKISNIKELAGSKEIWLNITKFHLRFIMYHKLCEIYFHMLFHSIHKTS